MYLCRQMQKLFGYIDSLFLFCLNTHSVTRAASVSWVSLSALAMRYGEACDCSAKSPWGAQHCCDSGWLMVWNMFYFSHILGIITPTDAHIFQRGRVQPPRWFGVQQVQQNMQTSSGQRLHPLMDSRLHRLRQRDLQRRHQMQTL